MIDFTGWIFQLCVYILQVIGEITGMGYELANIVIFVLIQPSLILVFFLLWRKERKKAVRKIVGAPIPIQTS